MNIARFSIEKPLMTWLVILGALLGGLWGFSSLGRLEDPAFTIKQVVISTQYPGATAEQVAAEVSEPLESAIQKMGEVDKITSMNQPGHSLITVEVFSTFGGDDLPPIWTKLRNRVSDAARSLPDGVSTPFVNDSFGDVFGMYYAVTADGFSDAEKHRLATFLRRELLTVEGVADVEVKGLPDEAIFIEPDIARMVNQNMPPQAIVGALATADSVVQAGVLRSEGVRTIIQAPDGSGSVEALASLTIGSSGEVINLFDVSGVYRGRKETPDLMVRYNGTDAFTIGVAGLSTKNIVDVGRRADARLSELDSKIPYGVTLHPIYQQHVVVDEASSAFMLNLAMSVSIVVIVLAIFMGWRAAVVVGATLLLTVVGTLFFMALFSIEMERISLGALIIAMGMLVDNAIVVAEGMQISMRRGKDSLLAADEAAAKTQIPLLGATVIGIMAFAGIGLSPDATGEFLFSLFAVIGISLLLSWVLALTVTPLLGHYFFRQGSGGEDTAYSGWMFRMYGWSLERALRFRWLVMAGLVAVTVVCFAGFGQVKQAFFPDSNTPMFFVHYKLPQGTGIHTTSDDLRRMEDWLAKRKEVVSVTTFVGQGASRFMLTYEAGKANPSYGHLIIQTETLDQIPPLQDALDAFGQANFPAGEFRTKRLVFGPGGGAPIELRLSGQNPDVLRKLSSEMIAVMQDASQNLHSLRTDWREQELVLKPIYATERAQTAGISRDEVAQVLQMATDGVNSGVYREGDRQIPIITRLPRDSQLGLADQVVFSSSTGAVLPIEQMIDGMEYETQNTLVYRRNRVPTLTILADIPSGITATQVQAEIQDAVESMTLPVGYRLDWGGEYESSRMAQKALGAQIPVSVLIMVLISVLLFNALRQPLIIWLLVPMSVNGVVVGLLATDMPFTFTALLGLLSLSGMLIKNGIVLVEEIDLVRAEGVALTEAIITASTSRLRPVMLAAVTTILGMAPLLGDAFFVSMAITIMGGLAFASILILVAAPVLYYLLFSHEEAKGAN